MIFTVSGVAADIDIQKLLTSIRVNEWLQEDLFRVKWFFLLGLMIFLTVSWWKLLAKTRLPEITLYAILTTALTMGIVEYGEELTLWDYPTDIIPLFPVLTAVNLAIVPMVYSLIYQHCNTWRSFAGTALLTTCILTFIFEPLLSWGGFYQLLRWKYHYTAVVYIMIALFVRWVVIKIYRIAETNTRKT